MCPLIDRIDIVVEVPALEFEELRIRKPAEKSEDIKKRVNAARHTQRQHFESTGFDCNARMEQKQLREFCELTEDGEALMKMAFEKMGLTARSYDRILRVARTIADLDGADSISPNHLAEAIQYRTYDFREPGGEIQE